MFNNDTLISKKVFILHTYIYFEELYALQVYVDRF